MPLSAFNTHLPLSLVSAMITPGIMILAAGSLINSTLLRLARVVDRARVIMDHVRSLRENGNPSEVTRYMKWLNRYSIRTVVIERALQVYYVSIALFVASTLAIALSDVTKFAPAGLAPLLVITGTCGLLVGTAGLIYDTHAGTGSLRDEIAESIFEAAPALNVSRSLSERV